MMNQDEIKTEALAILATKCLTAEIESGLLVVKDDRGNVFARLSDPIQLMSFAQGVEVGWKIAREAMG